MISGIYPHQHEFISASPNVSKLNKQTSLQHGSKYFIPVISKGHIPSFLSDQLSGTLHMWIEVKFQLFPISIINPSPISNKLMISLLLFFNLQNRVNKCLLPLFSLQYVKFVINQNVKLEVKGDLK